jgi:uncharacterized protein
MAAFLGRGWRFPVRLNGRGGLSYSAGDENIAEAIWIILGTPRRTRIAEPEFGCGIHDYVFAPNTPNTLALVTRAVQQALVRWEPRIDVLDVRAVSHPAEPNLLDVTVDYRIRANNAMHNIVYPFYINEGAV